MRSPRPLHAGLLPAETRAYKDTTAAWGTTHFYTLEAVRADGSVAGTHVWREGRCRPQADLRCGH